MTYKEPKYAVWVTDRGVRIQGPELQYCTDTHPKGYEFPSGWTINFAQEKIWNDGYRLRPNGPVIAYIVIRQGTWCAQFHSFEKALAYTKIELKNLMCHIIEFNAYLLEAHIVHVGGIFNEED